MVQANRCNSCLVVQECQVEINRFDYLLNRKRTAAHDARETGLRIQVDALTDRTGQPQTFWNDLYEESHAALVRADQPGPTPRYELEVGRQMMKTVKAEVEADCTRTRSIGSALVRPLRPEACGSKSPLVPAIQATVIVGQQARNRF